MFRVETKRSSLRTALGLFELTYHVAVRSIRKSQGNAIIGLAMNIFQTVLLIVVFYFMMTFLGMRGTAVRGDFVLYLMSGIFLFMTHTKAMGAVMGAEGPTSAIMKHAPMNTIVSILGAALGALYLQMLSVVVILYVYHTVWGPITIEDPIGAMEMLLLSWAAGIAIGTCFLAFRPWAPGFAGMAQSIYSRINMIASGKMFLANTLPHSLRKFFDWNPLFHTIDQARGDVFINYNPHFSSISYPLYLTLIFLVIGLMAEFYTRQYASASWSAGK